MKAILENVRGSTGRWWLLMAQAWLLPAVMAHAATYHVVVSGGNDGNDGLSWGDALATISNAMTRAGDGDTVMLSNGTFSIAAQIDLTNAVTFTSTNGWQSTMVDAGNVTGRRVFYMTNENAVIDGISITRGYAYSSSSPQYYGGGIYMTAGLVRDCSITNNRSYWNGAGMYISGGTVSNCIITKGYVSSQQAGGVYMNGAAGVVEDCTIRGNSSVREAGAVFIGSSGGTIRNCTITENYSSSRANGAIYMSAGLVENCLVAHNSAGNYYNRGTISLFGGEVRFCTVADNQSSGSSGGIWASGGTVRNCIVYNNKLSTGADGDVVNTEAAITYSCSPDLATGIGNTTGDPEFEDRPANDYRLAPGSACIDTGTNITGIASDIEGSPRPSDGDGNGTAVEDIGCYEAAAANAGVFRCNFTAPTNQANGSLNAQFTAVVYGSQTNGLYYWWDYDNNGSTDEEGADTRVVSHTYVPGTYSVRLTVSNSNNDVVTRLKTSYIAVYASQTYVSTNGANTTPFATWATAADNIQDAVDSVMEGGTVSVSNGTYLVNANVSLDKAVTVRSANGADATIVQKGSSETRLFSLSHSNAVVDGFTLLNGDATVALNKGGGIYMTDGTVMNSVITNGLAQYGGGIYMTGGTVTNCTVAKCRASDQGGGGIWMTGGRVVASDVLNNICTRAANGVYVGGGELISCRISGNSTGWGAAVYGSGACVIRNCLITDNAGGSYEPIGGGGGMYMNNAGARAENCTIVGNETLGVEGGGIKLVSGTVTNCIVYYNTLTASGAQDDIAGTAGTNNVRFSCSPDLTDDPTGTGNLSTEPGFTDKDNGDFSLAAGAPCIDAGADLTAVVDDIDGTARPQDGDGVGGAAHDMGCYEAPDAGGGPLGCNFSAPTNEAPLSLTAIFTAVLTGANTNGLYYWWDFENDGSVDDEGYGKGIVSKTYGTGYYTVKLTVSNGIAQVASKTQVDYIKVYAATTYVATNGTPAAPYDTWATAATNLQDAVDTVMAGGAVWVSNGTYLVNTRVSLAKDVTVRSVNGASATIAKKGSATAGLFALSHPGAVLDGLTLRDGDAGAATGGGVFMSEGTIRNCVITNGYAWEGGGVYMSGGTVTNTTIVDCKATRGGNSQKGGGVRLLDGLVVDCEILGNYTIRAASGVYMSGGELHGCLVRGNYGGWGAAVFMAAPCTMRNCLVTGNEGGGYGSTLGDGGGICMSHAGAHVENCTVVGNRSNSGTYGGYGGGIDIRNNGTVTNCIVYYNSAALGGDDIYVDTAVTNVGHTCSPDLIHDPSGTGNITSAPEFTDTGSGYGLSHVFGDYHPLKTSPCIDAGIEQPWMATGLDLDLEPRLLNKTADMGAYETFLPPKGTMIMIR